MRSFDQKAISFLNDDGSAENTSYGKGFFSSTNTLREPESKQPMESSDKFVAGMRNDLGFFGRMAVDRASRDEALKVVGELIVQKLAAQKERIVYQLCLDLDSAKKTLFVESLREGSRIERELAERSTEFERRLMDLALDKGLEGHQERRRRIDHLDELRRTNRIDDACWKQHQADIERWAAIYGANLNAKVEIILRNHAQQIERTLALFRERTINGHNP